MILEKTFTINQKSQALEVISECVDLSRSKIKDAMEKGSVWLDDGSKVSRIRRSKNEVLPGQTIYLYYDEQILSKIPAEPLLIDSMKTYSVWFKPKGIFSQGSKWGDHCSIIRIASKGLQKESFPVHRLDRATSGLMVIAHSKNSARLLSDQFAQREVKKKYLAICDGVIDTNKIIDYELDGKGALTEIFPVDTHHDKSLIEIDIRTGRKHQIRRHLSMIDHPVIGDRLYSNSSAKHEIDLCLQSIYLGFTCVETGNWREFNIDESQKLKLEK